MRNIIQKIKCAFGMHPWGRTIVVKPNSIVAHCRCCQRNENLT